MCKTCSWRPERHSEVCDTCRGYDGTYRLYSKKRINNVLYIGLPHGDRKKLKSLYPKIGKHKVDDRRSKAKAKFKGSFDGTLKDFQVTAVKALKKTTYGVLKSKPRTGKTVMGVALVLRLGLKTLILTHQDDLLRQFLDTFLDENMTDIASIEKFENTKIVGICKTVQDFEKHDICLATYQTFLSTEGQKKLQKIKDMFGLVLIDEIHRSAATCYSRVVSKFNCWYKHGLTATFDRKDGKEFLVQNIVGPVIHDTNVKTLLPTVSYYSTGLTYDKDAHWTWITRWISRNKVRNDLIVDHAVKDIKNGKSVLIPVTFIEHVTYMVDNINKRLRKKVARAFNGRVKKDEREKILEQAREGRVKCVVAIRSMLLGINVPRWDTLYEVMPIANTPVFTQEVNRITTPYKDKVPEIRFFIDNMGVSHGCFRKCWQVLKKFPIHKESIKPFDIVKSKKGGPSLGHDPFKKKFRRF